jgi:predicted GNAT superfamily acetyltransferase
MRIEILDPHAPSWAAELDRIGFALRPQHNSTLFPYHFLQITLTRIGGHAGWVQADSGPVGVAFLFPRQRDQAGGPVYTLRFHALPHAPTPDQEAVVQAAGHALGGAMVVFYDPAAPQYYSPTHISIAGIDIGRPDSDEAATIPSLHQQIWGSPPEFLYPADLHSIDFAAGSSLVARVEEGGTTRCVGFLVGFYKFGGARLPADWHARFGGDFRLESQIMGVLPAYRGLRIANLLKKIQAEQAWREGIGIVNWTADPLQYPNAALNFGLLRAVAFDYAPDLYPFRNDLNRVPASRFGVTWLVGSERVRNAPLVGSRASVLDLSHHPYILRLDPMQPLPATLDTSLAAIEIPDDWTRMQNEAPTLALKWRTATDALFARLIGCDAGQYCVTGVAVDADRRYLLIEQVSEALWTQLGRS